ncbi:MAG: glutamate mutase L, partial [Anaerolineales bacterium]
MSSYSDAEVVLSVDIGSVYTRASLFTVVEGRYRLVATARASSTVGPPLYDAREGIRMALDEVQAVSGCRIVDETEALIMPSSGDRTGVDAFAATVSAGPEVRTVLVGLMPGVSLESARRVGVSTYLNVVEEIGLTDQRREERSIDLILAARPDLILVAGGTDGGASRAVTRILETVRIAVGLLPGAERPHVVFAGNRHLSAHVADKFSEQMSVSLTPNLRPALDHEDLGPCRRRLAEVIMGLRASRILGYDELLQWSSGTMMLTCDAFGRVVQYLSQVYNPEKGVLGIDLGACQTTVAAALAGDLRLNVCTDLGMGSPLPGILKHSSLEGVMRWLPSVLPAGMVQDYIYDKALYPSTVPVEQNEVYIEYALAREMIRVALARARADWPWLAKGTIPGLLPSMEPILASGGVLALAPRLGQSALALLDAVQPTGITTLVLDPHNIAPGLGAVAGTVPMMMVQGLASGSFIMLGTVVAPVGRARRGRRVLRLRMEREQGDGLEGEVVFGQLVVLPLKQGEHARLTLRPERGFDVGFGRPGRAGAIRVIGGAIGLIIDARGRPLQLHRDPA